MALTVNQAIATQASLAYLGRPQDVGALTTFGLGLATGAVASPTAAQLKELFATAESKVVFGASATMSSVISKSFELVGRTATAQNITDIVTWATSAKLDISQLPWEIMKIALSTESLLPQASQVAWARLAVAYQFAEDISASPTTLQSLATSTTQQDAARTVISGVTSFATIATAYPASGSGTASTFISGSATSTGSTFTLTTNIDTFAGTSGNDTITGTEANFGSLDTINGATGTDTLLLQLTTAALTLSGTQISNIEVLQISQGTNNSTATNVGGLSGLTSIANSASTTNLVITGLATPTMAMAASNTTLATTFEFTEASLAGTADTATVTLNNVTAAADININSVTANSVGFETIALISSGSVANSIDLLTNDTGGVATVTIAGAAAITVNLSTNVTTTATTINASTATGAVTLTGFGAAVHTVTGGSGADSFTFAGNFVGAENATTASRDTISGGSGRDTLNVTSAVAVAASAVAQTTVSGIEIISISDASAGSVNLTNFTGADTLNFLNATVGAHTYTFNTASTATFITGAAGDNARAFVIGGSGATDVLNFTTVSGTNFGSAAQTFTGVETLNIATGTAAAGTVTFGGVVTMAPTAGGTGTIVVTGGNALTITGVLTASSLNGSAMTAALTTSAAAANAINLTGGAGVDTLNGSTANDVISGGAGIDSIHGRAGNDILTGGAGADVFIQTTGVNNGTDSITDFTTGASGDAITISVGGTGAGQSVLRSGAGNASVANGATVSIAEVSAATTLVAQNVIVLTGTFATAALVQTAIEAGGSRQLTLANANTANDDILIVWSDGVLGHVSNVNIGSGATTITAANATVLDHVTLTGITNITAGQFVAANFNFIT